MSPTNLCSFFILVQHPSGMVMSKTSIDFKVDYKLKAE